MFGDLFDQQPDFLVLDSFLSASPLVEFREDRLFGLKNLKKGSQL